MTSINTVEYPINELSRTCEGGLPAAREPRGHLWMRRPSSIFIERQHEQNGKIDACLLQGKGPSLISSWLLLGSAQLDSQGPWQSSEAKRKAFLHTAAVDGTERRSSEPAARSKIKIKNPQGLSYISPAPLRREGRVLSLHLTVATEKQRDSTLSRK